jgi:hypothetical protein
MPTTTNYGWTTPADTDLLKDGAAAIRTLGSSIDSTLKTQIDAQIPDSLLTTKGDIIAATGASTPARLAIGTNDQILIADSTAATGMKWGTVTSGGMTLISRQTPSNASSLSFSSISSSYTDLLLRWTGLYGGASTEYNIRLNNISSSSYSNNYNLNGSTGGGTYTQISNQVMIGSNATSSFGNTNATGYLLVKNYASATYAKAYTAMYTTVSAGGTIQWANIEGALNTTSAITSIDIFRSAGSVNFNTATNGFIELWGVK